MGDITIKVSDEQWQRLAAAAPDRAAQAARNAINRTATEGSTKIARRLTEEIGAKYGAIRRRITVTKATTARLEARIQIKGRELGLINFKAKWNPGSAGTTITVLGQKVTLPHAFIRVGVGGTKQVFLRESPAKVKPTKGYYAGWKLQRGPDKGSPLLRQKLTTQKGPSVAKVYEKTPGLAEQQLAGIQATLEKNITQQAKFIAGETPNA